MAEEIINRVAQSKLITFDLEEHFPPGQRLVLDISNWLFEGLLLREKEFRKLVNAHNWEQYQDTYLALTCSTDAIIPGWAYMLIASHANTFAKKVIVGSLEELNTLLYAEILNSLDISQFKDKPVIIKGCSNKPVPQNAYLMAIEKIQAVAKSVMYGEACSSVPLFKRK
ncbi:hypothetical protein GCM10011414_06200 [Croceivirga lutea]|uniref:DUF2480 family protein n=1 Tax=Croceivirga lutea TaxID=1775167 RepID=UPI00163B283E|nr:DUF2480 family protein [Croceivirga lutea]GGG39549.1 hypothetical protein GCM10011414_06200 [Croceivirga lutea]